MWHMVVLCGSGGGMRKYMWAPEQNLSKNGRKTGGGEEVVLPGAGRPGSWPNVALSGRMSGLWIRGWIQRSSPGEVKSGQNSEKFLDVNWGKVDGKLDLPTTHEIRGSNPTKLHHTNKSQKNWGYFCGEFSNLGRNQQNKARKHNREAPKS